MVRRALLRAYWGALRRVPPREAEPPGAGRPYREGEELVRREGLEPATR
jgi:hypothetical protein